MSGGLAVPGPRCDPDAIHFGGNEFAYTRDVHSHHEINELLDPERKGQATLGAPEPASSKEES